MLRLLASFVLVIGIINDGTLGARLQHRKVHGNNVQGRASGCTVSSVSYPVGHTMCLSPASNMTPKPPSAADQQALVDKHNEYRSAVTPKPSNMMKIYWDDKLAVVAQAWAETCPTLSASHDSDRSVPAYGISIGQNGAFGRDSYTSAVTGWYSEVADFTYGGSNVFNDVGHFIQVVAGHSIAVGCGGAYCPDNQYKDVIFCNYAFNQEAVRPSYGNPYEKNTKGCTDTCGSNCIDNLCDCGLKICVNGGTLDTKTCTCQCPGIYSGDTCDALNCPATAETFCPYDEIYCGHPLAQAACPYTCGLCS